MRPTQKILFTMVLLIFVMPAQAYQAVIFDCDGVLVDTEHLKFLAWQKAFTEEHIHIQESDYLPLVGLSSEAIANAIQKQKKVHFNKRALISRKNVIYVNLQKQGVPQFKDAVDFLKKLIRKKKQLGVKIAIASSAPHSEILENLRQLHVKASDLDAILSGHDDLKHIHDPEGTNKPKPYIYQLAAQKLGFKPSDCLVLEDSGAGVTAAVKAGMAVIAVPNKYTVNHDFSGAMLEMGPNLDPNPKT